MQDWFFDIKIEVEPYKSLGSIKSDKGLDDFYRKGKKEKVIEGRGELLKILVKELPA